jgi:hypothetical protein
MKEANDINFLAEEKNEVTALFNKEAIIQFEEQISMVPANYFNTFPEKIVPKIQVKKKPSLLMQLNKLSIAPSNFGIIRRLLFFCK